MCLGYWVHPRYVGSALRTEGLFYVSTEREGIGAGARETQVYRCQRAAAERGEWWEPPVGAQPLLVF